jgi:hypothetical protein
LGALPPSPWDLTHYRQDCWPSAERTALARAESRPLSRCSDRVPAEPYPPLRCNQCSRKPSTKPKAVYTKLLTPPVLVTLRSLPHFPPKALHVPTVKLGSSPTLWPDANAARPRHNIHLRPYRAGRSRSDPVGLSTHLPSRHDHGRLPRGCVRQPCVPELRGLLPRAAGPCQGPASLDTSSRRRNSGRQFPHLLIK